MKTVTSLRLVLALYWLLALALPFCLAQVRNEPTSEIFEKVKDSVILLNDGQNSSYGIYLASSRNQKFMYVLSSNQLSIGIEKRIRGVLLDGKSKQFKVEKLNSDPVLKVAIYKLESPPKNLTTITLIPQDSLHTNAVVWALGPPANPHDLASFQVVNIGSAEKFIEVSGNLTSTFLGSPLFDSHGRVLGCITDSREYITEKEPVLHEVSRVASILELLEYATRVLQDMDLYPIWKEIYPTQYTIKQVMESVALLDTKKSGAGILLGWSRSKTDTSKIGYVLTAFHVVSEGPARYSVQLAEHVGGQILGETLPETIDEDLDLAIVKIMNCPAIKPVTFIRTNDLEKQERLFTPEHIATIGYNESTVAWRYKFGSLTRIADKTVETNLPLETGDSGGPIFNENGEVLALNLKTAVLDSTKQDIQSVSANSRAILKYLNDKLRRIDFEEKWEFYKYPSFWSRNRIWLLSSGTAVAGGVTAAILSKRDNKTPPTEQFVGHPEFP